MEARKIEALDSCITIAGSLGSLDVMSSDKFAKAWRQLLTSVMSIMDSVLSELKLAQGRRRELLNDQRLQLGRVVVELHKKGVIDTGVIVGALKAAKMISEELQGEFMDG
ncbi:hypothetical protein HY489_04975 [Candidatus Woesearchaeota archaeon]|nr:hypothetical protein [Candidatus Woesearchaeota archaeon]